VKVVVASPNGPDEEWGAIKDAGHELAFGQIDRDKGGRLSDGELIELCQGADLLVSINVSRQVVEALPELLTIVGPAVGTEKIAIDAATENGILVCHSPSRENVIGVAEASIGQMLALAKRVKRKEERLRGGEWGQRFDRGFLMWGKTVGIIGLGRTGGGVARRLMGWDLEILGCDPYVRQERFDQLGVKRVDLQTLLKESDFVSVHVTITPETHKIIGRDELSAMKPTAYFINTSRGEALDQDAMCEAIENDWIAGAALDVFDPEPLPQDSPLRDLDPQRVILTPHNVAASEASRVGNQRLAMENALAVLSGVIPHEYVKNPEVLPTWRGRST
jgi:phosphoglycerate dehydrogenase-like enzyme